MSQQQARLLKTLALLWLMMAGDVFAERRGAPHKDKEVPKEPVYEEDDGERDFIRPGPNDPIDIVYTWVNGSDTRWLQTHNEYLSKVKENIDEGTRLFSDNGELRYSLRSLHAHAKAMGFRHIFLVTEDQVPSWVNTSHPDITVVPHTAMMDKDDVPNFSTFAIELNLDRIPGLAEHFVYLNDDFFVGRAISRDALVDPNDKRQIIFMSRKYVNKNQCEKTHPWRCAHVYTTKKLNDKFGRKQRFYAAHAPLLMNRKVMRRLRSDFKAEFAETSSHRFRGLGDNLTLYFLYSQYVMEKGYPAKLKIGNSKDTYMYVDMFEDAKGNRRDLDDPSVRKDMWDRLTEVGDSQFFVINKGDGEMQLIQRWMAIRYPVPSPYEKHQDTSKE